MSTLNQKGFTLLELVLVIVILGILAAAAIPNYINLSGRAGTAAAANIAGTINSASNINYAASRIGSAHVSISVAANGVYDAGGCAVVGNWVLSSGVPSSVTWGWVSNWNGSGAGSTAVCTITVSGGSPATVTFVATQS